jgi:hypothetical protein
LNQVERAPRLCLSPPFPGAPCGNGAGARLVMTERCLDAAADPATDFHVKGPILRQGQGQGTRTSGFFALRGLVVGGRGNDGSHLFSFPRTEVWVSASLHGRGCRRPNQSSGVVRTRPNEGCQCPNTGASLPPQCEPLRTKPSRFFLRFFLLLRSVSLATRSFAMAASSEETAGAADDSRNEMDPYSIMQL